MRSKNINLLAPNQSVIDMFASALITANTHIDNDKHLDGAWGVFVCLFWIEAILM